MEPCTFSLLKKALKLNMLGQVNPHRLRDELILILKEAKPYRYIKRIRELEGFSFVRKEISFSKRKLRFFRRAQASLSRYARNFKKHRKLEAWLIYLGGLVVDLPLGRVEKFLHDFGFKKGERIIISSIRRNLSKIKKLDKRVRPHVVYRILTLYSFESILFFHAYHSRGKLRKNIEYFLNTLVNIRLKTRGKDLKKLDFGPLTIYSKILTRLLYAKIDKGLKSKKEELAEAGRIYKRLS